MRTRFYQTLPIALVGLALITGCGSSSDSTTASTPAKATTYQQSDAHKSNPQEITAPSDDQVKSWPVAWCKVQPRMTRAQVFKIMGEPSTDESLEQARADQVTPQMTFEDTVSDQHYSAFFDAQDHVKQLDQTGKTADCAVTRR